MVRFERIVIIYNPNSTGNGKKLAQDFAVKANKVFSNADIKLVATEYAQHAVKIASEVASGNKETLIVSSSGDGGYHEVINGLFSAKKAPKNVTAAVLPAGNANDHSRTMHDSLLTKRLDKAKQTRIDLLKVTIAHKGTQTVRYAHSYAGLGVTPHVAKELNKHNLNPVREIYLLIRAFRRFKSFKIKHNNQTLHLDNLVFSNINQMAKVLTLADKNLPQDGRFELVVTTHRGKLRLLYKFAKAAVSLIRPQKRAERFDFKTLQSTPMQLDGEVIELQKDSEVVVEIAKQALKTLV